MFVAVAATAIDFDYWNCCYCGHWLIVTIVAFAIIG